MAYLAGKLVLAIDAGAPNNGRGSSPASTSVKTAVVRRKSYPYVSAQAFRRWLRDTMSTLGSDASPTEREGRTQQRAQKAMTAADPIHYADDDLFGYMRAAARTSEEAATRLRDSPFMIGTFMAVEPARPTEDFGVMSRGIGEPVLHEHQFFTADLAAPFLLDLSRVGTFTLPGQSGLGRPNYLDGKTALKAAEAVRIGATSLSFRGQTAIRLPLETRRERVALLLEALAELTGGAKKTLHYGDRIPALVALVPMSGGVNPLGFVINGAEDGSGLRVQADVLRDELAAWDGEWEPPVRFGWRPGFRGSLRAEFVKDLSALGMHERVTIEHPRTMLRGLAAEIRAGDHEAWFEDRVR